MWNQWNVCSCSLDRDGLALYNRCWKISVYYQRSWAMIWIKRISNPLDVEPAISGNPSFTIIIWYHVYQLSGFGHEIQHPTWCKRENSGSSRIWVGGSKNGTLTLKTGHTLVLLFGSMWRPEMWSRHAGVPSSKSRSLEARFPKLPKLERNPGSCNVGPPAMFVGFPIDKSI